MLPTVFGTGKRAAALLRRFVSSRIAHPIGDTFNRSRETARRREYVAHDVLQRSGHDKVVAGIRSTPSGCIGGPDLRAPRQSWPTKHHRPGQCREQMTPRLGISNVDVAVDVARIALVARFEREQRQPCYQCSE
jgi:hypothetical protein